MTGNQAIETIRRRVRPGVVGAVIACALFPPVWNAFFPELVGDPITVRLTGVRPNDQVEVPTDAIRAQRVANARQGRDDLFAFAFDLPRGGAFSVYGLSSNRAAQPLVLRVNGRRITAMAFHQRTGSMHSAFEKHLIARSVALRPGRNVAAVAGPRVAQRTLLLELQREEPLGTLRYGALFLAAAFVLMLRGAAVARLALPAPARLATAAALYAAAIVAIATGLLHVSDGHLLALGEQDPVKARRLRRVEDHYRARAEREPRAEGYEVFVMGDSTHYWSLPWGHRMVPVLSRAVAQVAGEDVDVVGMSGGALNAFDFYLLLNRVARERPDVVVIPVGMRSFADWWLHNPGYRYPDMDHYVGPAEFVRAWNLSVAGRELRLVPWGLRRVDARWFDGRIARLLRGVKTYFEGEFELAEEQLAVTTLAAWEPIRELARDPLAGYARWPGEISDAHPLLEAFRLINGLAARKGIGIIYYTENVNVSAQRERGRELPLQQIYRVIEDAIAGDPGVSFLRLSDANPPEMFSDRVDHLTEDGIETVAAAIAREIAVRKRAAEKRGGP